VSFVLDSFNTLYDQHGTDVTRRPPNGASDGSQDQTAIPSLFTEERVDRSYDPTGERTMRTATLTVVNTVDYAWGEQWQVNGEWWQVERSPLINAELRILALRRDDKVKTTVSRGHIL